MADHRWCIAWRVTALDAETQKPAGWSWVVHGPMRERDVALHCARAFLVEEPPAHGVWVCTRAPNRIVIEQAINDGGIGRLQTFDWVERMVVP